MSRGSGLRGRGKSWLATTSTHPLPGQPAGEDRVVPPVGGPWCHRGRPDARAPRALIPGRLSGCLGCLLLLLLEGPHLGERPGPGDVGDRSPRALLPVVPGGLPPAGRGDPVLLPEEGEEDLRLLRAEARQLPQPPQQ